jgi:hypothetical protein
MLPVAHSFISPARPGSARPRRGLLQGGQRGGGCGGRGGGSTAAAPAVAPSALTACEAERVRAIITRASHYEIFTMWVRAIIITCGTCEAERVRAALPEPEPEPEPEPARLIWEIAAPAGACATEVPNTLAILLWSG